MPADSSPFHRVLAARVIKLVAMVAALALAVTLAPRVTSVAVDLFAAEPGPDVSLSTHAGGSVALPVAVPSSDPDGSTVRVDLTRVDGSPVNVPDTWAAVEREPGTGRYREVRLSGGTGEVDVAGDEGTLRVQASFPDRGDYRLTATVRQGGRQVVSTTADVQVSSAFVRVGSVEVDTEIIAATPDGNTLVSTISDVGVGLIDITNPAHPGDVVEVPVARNMTSTAVTPDGTYALAVSTDSVLGVVDLAARETVHTIDIPAGADAVSISPDGKYAVVAVEAEGPGQGAVLVIDLVGGGPAEWTTRIIPFDETDPAFEAGSDLQPEFIDIDERNYAAMSFQENNAVAVVDLESGDTISLFNLGRATRLYDNDSSDNVFVPTDEESNRRAPDGVAWGPGGYIFTPNEDGGARSWSVFTTEGEVVFDSGEELEESLSMAGMYSDRDPQFESIVSATYGEGSATEEALAVVGSERMGTLSVYRVEDPRSPRLSQNVASGVDDQDPRPEGMAAIPGRDLLAVANEDEDTVVIFRRVPTVAASDRPTLTSNTTVWREIVEWAPTGEDSLAAITGEGDLLRAVATPTEVLITDRTTPRHPSEPRLAPVAVAADPHGEAWVGFRDPDSAARLVFGRTAVDGTVDGTVELDLRDVLGTTSGQLLGAAISDGQLWAVVRPQVGSDMRLVRHRLATGAVTWWRFAAPREDGQLARLPDGDLAWAATVTVPEPAAGLPREQTVIHRVSVTGVARGGHARLAPMRNLATDDAFWGADDSRVSATTVMPSGDLLAHAAGDRIAVLPTLRVRGFAGTAPGRQPEVGVRLIDATAVGAAPFTVEVTTDRNAGVQVQARPAGDAAAGWRTMSCAGTADLQAGTATLEPCAPTVDGAYDVRVLALTGDGATASATASQQLTVSTPDGEVTVSAPTTQAPATTYAGGRFTARLATGSTGVLEVAARAAGGDWTPLTVADGGEVAQAGNVAVEVTAPDVGGTHDLRMRFRAGGDGPVHEVQVPSGLTVTVPTAPALEATPSAESPVTVPSLGTLELQGTVDQSAEVAVWLQRQGAKHPVKLGVRTTTLTARFQIEAPEQEGIYDVRMTATNAAGLVTEVVEAGAVVVDNPPPAMDVLNLDSPGYEFPATVVAEGATSFGVIPNQFGTVSVFYRLQGEEGDWTLGDRGEGRLTGTALSFRAPGADGSYDLRFDFVSLSGQDLSEVVPAGLVVDTPAPQVNVTAPTTAEPVTLSSGEYLSVRGTASPQGRIDVFARPSGTTDEWRQLAWRQIGSTFDVAGALPALRSGPYDLKVQHQNTLGATTSVVETAALVVANPDPAPNLREPTSLEAYKRSPGSTLRVFVSSPGINDVVIESRPHGGDEWTTLTEQQAVNGSFYGPVTAPATPGAHDLRVVATNSDGTTATDVEENALHIGRGPVSPVVINEYSKGYPGFAELRNTSDVAVDISGWAVRRCRAGETWATVPDGTALDPGQHWLIGLGGWPSDATDLATPDQMGDRASGDGAELVDADGRLVDAIGWNEGQGCWEGKPLTTEPQGDRLSAKRDSAGTDTDVNASDFTVGPATPRNSTFEATPITGTAGALDGTGAVGTELVAVAPAWNVAGVTTEIEWLRDGEAIAGETAQTYDVRPTDVGRNLAVRFTGIKDGHPSGVVTTDSVVGTAGRAPTAEPPAITGPARVGSTVSVSDPEWDLDGTETARQWTLDGAPILGETLASYRVRPGDLGKLLAVQFTGILAGHAEGSVTTEPVTVRIGEGQVLLEATAANVPAGSSGTVAVDLSVDDATGMVEVLRGSEVIGTTEVDSAHEDVAIPAGSVPVGTHTLIVRYAGDSAYDPAQTTTTLHVVKAPTATSAEATPSRIEVGETSTVEVDVTASGLTPSGTVGLYVGPQLVGGGDLAGGIAAIQVGPFAEPGTVVVAVRYYGDASAEPSQTTVPLQITAAPGPSEESTTNFTIDDPSLEVGRGRTTLDVTVAAESGSPTGSVVATTSDGEVLGAALLGPEGEARVDVGPFGEPGTESITVTYLGDARFLGSSHQAELAVTKVRPRMTTAARTVRVRRGAVAALPVTLTAPGIVVEGRIKATVRGKGVKRARVMAVSSGTAVVRLGRYRKAGKFRVRLAFLGDENTMRTTRTLILRVRR